MLAWSGGSGSLIDGGAWVKLTDFGIVRVAEDAGLSNSGIVLGTADYFSPEQARGEPLTGSSDLSLAWCSDVRDARRAASVCWSDSRLDCHATCLIQPTTIAAVQPNGSFVIEQFIKRALQKEPKDSL